MMATRSPATTPLATSQCAKRDEDAESSAKVMVSSRPSAWATRTATRPGAT